MLLHQLKLVLLDNTFAISKLPPSSSVPAWAAGGPLVSITRTPEELSVVCLQHVVPDGQVCERGWRGLRVEGPLDFYAVGVLASLVSPLANAGISVFVVSTFDTDYLLVKEESFKTAVEVLRQHGHSIR